MGRRDFLLADFVVSFACRLPCEARNAVVEWAELTTAIVTGRTF